jgi:hypothetical protein
LAAKIKKGLFELLYDSLCYCVAFDESFDLVDSEQMSIFVRFFDIKNKVFREELLALLTFEGKTRGEDLFKSFDDFMKKSDFSYDKIGSISLIELTGKEKELLKRIRDNNFGILTHQSVLINHVMIKTRPRLSKSWSWSWSCARLLLFSQNIKKKN